MPHYLASLKDGDQIRISSADEANARARIRDLYHLREPGFPLALDDPTAAAEIVRQKLLKLLAGYLKAVDEAQLAVLVGEKRQLMERTGRPLDEPDAACS